MSDIPFLVKARLEIVYSPDNDNQYYRHQDDSRIVMASDVYEVEEKYLNYHRQFYNSDYRLSLIDFEAFETVL